MLHKNYEKNFKKRSANKNKLFNHEIKKFILLLQKNEYMNDWENFSETSFPEKEDFYSHLNMKDITDADYAHAKEKISK